MTTLVAMAAPLPTFVGSASPPTAASGAAVITDSSDHRADLPRPYKCHMCDKAFHRLEHQTRHIRTHTGEKPHACHYPGCSKRFSRSDELTRHSRIHSNPNSRRNNRSQQTAAAAAAAAAAMGHNERGIRGGAATAPASSSLLPPSLSMMHLPRPDMTSRSAPPSSVASPNVSPPLSFASHVPLPSAAGLVAGASRRGSSNPLDINLLATAACQVERDRFSIPPLHLSRASIPGHVPPESSKYQCSNEWLTLPYGPSRQLPPLSAYGSAQPMVRSRSAHEEDPSLARQAKRSRPSSPSSTVPSSPTCSHDSGSSTPDHTPLETPSQSPRLRPFATGHASECYLPPLRELSLQTHAARVLAPIEPPMAGGAAAATAGAAGLALPAPTYPLQPLKEHGGRITDILSRPEGAQRPLLPMPSVSIVPESESLRAAAEATKAPPAAPAAYLADFAGRQHHHDYHRQ